MAYNKIFSEYDIESYGFKFEGDSEAALLDTVGSFEEAMEVRTVVKNKRNMPWKTRTKATGSGEVKLSLHIQEDIYYKMFGQIVEGYKTGVAVYGTISSHKPFCMTAKVTDEDGIVKLKAYPCASIKKGISRKVETNGETVAEIELTISVDPDDDGIGRYEIIIEDGTDSTITDSWMQNFSTDLVKASS